MIPRETHTVTSPADGAIIRYVKSGAGAPVVLVHGGGADEQSLALVARALSSSRTVLLVARRGRTEPSDAARYRLDDEYEDIAAVAAAADEPVDVFAHSFGSLCTLGAIARRPELFRSAALYEPPIPTVGFPYASDDTLTSFERHVDEGRHEEAALLFLRDIVKVPQHEMDAWRAVPVSWRATVGLTHAMRWEGRTVRGYRLDPAMLSRIEIPVSVLLGELSHPQYRASAEALVAQLPRAETMVLRGQYHLASAFAPDLLAEAILTTAARA